MLPTQLFMRVNRSYIVALDKIRKVDRNDCIYIGEEGTSAEIIRVTEAYRETFQQYLQSKFPGLPICANSLSVAMASPPPNTAQASSPPKAPKTLKKMFKFFHCS